MKKAISKANQKRTADTRRAAERITGEYRIVLTAHGAKGFVASAVEMPLVLGRGRTESECLADTRNALVATVAHMLAAGEQPPSPASEGKREVQLNIRLTADERLRIEERARQAGFRSIADFMRRAALRTAI